MTRPQSSKRQRLLGSKPVHGMEQHPSNCVLCGQDLKRYERPEGVCRDCADAHKFRPELR